MAKPTVRTQSGKTNDPANKKAKKKARKKKRKSEQQIRQELLATPKIVRKKSAISGWGVYAGQAIEKNTVIVEYKGELVTQEEAWEREQRYLPKGRIWLFTINGKWARDAAFGGNNGRYVNHACKPNCYSDVFGKTIVILAKRRIEPGEELTYDYNTDGIAKISCLCRPGCKRIL